MIKFKQIFPLLLTYLLTTSCIGQNKSEQKSNTNSTVLSFTSKKTKLTKTQGTNEYQNVHCMIQDKRGNIWFGTTGEGVYKYDGKEFTQFTEKDGLKSNKVWSVLEDKAGNIWFGTDNGLSRFDGEKISKILLNQSVSTQPEASGINAVWSMMQDKTGIIWFGTENGLYCYDGKTFSFFLDNPNLTNESGVTLKSVQCIFEDKNGNMWFGSGPMALEGIIFYNGKSLTNFKPQNEGWIRKITEDKNGTLLFATRHNGVITYDGKSFTNFPEPQKIRKDLITTVLSDSNGNIWYGSDYTNDNDISSGGLWKFDGKSFVEFSKKDGLVNSSIYSLMEDKAGNIWIGSRNCGLYCLTGQNFTSFSE
ncbi:MAG: two-component regulator propeller domain-containing protein [Flavobacterium sp.]